MQFHTLLLAFLLFCSPPALLCFEGSEALVTVIVVLLEMVICRRSGAAQNDDPVPVPVPLRERSEPILLEELV